uniref:DUF4657 domain-containing protein n=1 Tax=Salvator merianae TaxID=96440 RepID=A0A8D0DUU1_SALMN
MASNDHSPSTPVGSEKSFSLDCLEGFQPAVEDSPPTTPPESCLSEEESEDPGGPVQDPVYHRNLSVSKKLAQVVQRSQKHRLLGHSPGQLAPKAQSVVDSGGLTSYRLHQLLAFDESMDAGTDVCGGTSLSMPGQGLRYLEHICQMLEKIAQLQQANLRLQRQHQVLECRIRSQEAENVRETGQRLVVLSEDHSEENSGDPESVRVEPQTEDPATPETVEEEDDAHPADSWHPHHFRARSASDTRILRNTARNLSE